MLGLRFFVCDGCETVHASPDEPPTCRDCAGATLREITHRLQADTYFLPPTSEPAADPQSDWSADTESP